MTDYSGWHSLLRKNIPNDGCLECGSPKTEVALLHDCDDEAREHGSSHGQSPHVHRIEAYVRLCPLHHRRYDTDPSRPTEQARRRKISAAGRRLQTSKRADVRAKISASKLGHSVSDDTREKIASSLRGRSWSEQRRRTFEETNEAARRAASRRSR